MSFLGWSRVAEHLLSVAGDDSAPLDDGQRSSLTWMAERLPKSGVVLADEVGTGKTRIACALVKAVLHAKGRVAVVVPHGLMHQWQKEAHILGMSQAKSFTSMSDFIQDAKTQPWEEIAPRPKDTPTVCALKTPRGCKDTEWLLISHGFRAPQVRQGRWPAEWRVALPSYVRAELSRQASRADGRTHVGKLLDDPHKTTHRIARAIEQQVRGHDRVKLRRRLDQLPPFRRGGDNTKLVEALQGDGRALVEELLGLWLGEFDLLVIDEAHKSRGEVDVDSAAPGAASGTVLARLVDALLRQPAGGRRLCLTATPMELELSQWLDLLSRARSGIDQERGRQVVKRLHDAAARAAVAPDEGSRLDDLCAAAKNFTKTLAPHVTRRRRDEDPLVTSFRDKLPDGRRRDAPHPHRNVRPLRVGWTDTVGENSPWRDVLFAAECMSQSARGLTLKDTENWPRAVRDAYTKLSAGHVSIDLSETNKPLQIPEPGTIDEHTRGKIVRTAYWYRQLRVGRKQVLEAAPSVNGAEINPDAEHPRILAAVKEIESWTLKREKVLVFGVFLQPLHILMDVLNVRRALRDADQERPSALNFFPERRGSTDAKQSHRSKVLLGIASQQLKRMRTERDDNGEPVLKGRLASGDGAEMRRALADSHKAYERLRDKVRRRAKKPVDAWRSDPTLLGGAPAERELEGALEDHLVSFVLDDFLATTSESDEVSDERFADLATEFVEDRLRPLLGELGSDDANDKKRPEEQAEQRIKSLKELVKDSSSRQSQHARLLDGDKSWQTRRYMQAAFNRDASSPYILIAQSQVGREGLNLHESCRVVVQFHAEWNPAVLEQQIGRVDRKGSLWEQRAQQWLADGALGEPPFIEVRQLIFEGTYDAYQWDRVMRRQLVFDASLFGSLLPVALWESLSEEKRAELRDAAPNFQPLPVRRLSSN